MRRAATPAVLGLLAGLALVPAGVSAPPSPACGVPVTASAKLTANLSCTVDGIVVGADGITIDLAGHTVDGDGGASDRGIVNELGYDGVTVRNGTVTDFGTGAELGGGAVGNTLDGLRIRGSGADAVFLANAPFAKVTRSVLVHNGVGAGGYGVNGVPLVSTDPTVTGNTIVGNSSGGIFLGGARAVVAKNRVAQNGDKAITIVGAQSAVTGNTVLGGAGAGVSIAAADVTASKNEVIRADRGFDLAGADRATLTANTVLGSKQEGILVASSDRVTVAKNRVEGSGEDGLAVDAGSDDGIFTANTLTGNGEDGIELSNATAVMVKNVARANAHIGIWAVVPGTDGGGNRARDNYALNQCVNVDCAVAPFALALARVAPARAARAAGPVVVTTCPYTATTDIVLDADLTGCVGNGITVGAPDITIDLGGHLLEGDGLGVDAGIVNGAGHAGVVVRNGRVTGFARGVLLGGNAQENRVLGLAIRDAPLGGIDLGDADLTVVKGSSVVGTGGAGVALGVGSGLATVTGNALVANFAGGVIGSGDGHRVTKNLIAVHPNYGVSLTGVANVVSGNALIGNTSASVDLHGGTAVAAKNRVVSHAPGGIHLSNAPGPQIQQNSVVSSGTGIWLDTSADFADVSRNTVRGAGGGIVVAAGAGFASLVGNAVLGSVADGVEVLGPAATLAKNASSWNAGHGFTGVVVNDLGGNTARDNGTLPECVNVTC